MTDSDQERRVERIRASIPATQWAIEELTPRDWLHVAEFLTGLLSRKPLANGAGDTTGWAAERLILGCLATELRVNAHEAGETTPFVERTFSNDPIGKARNLVEDLAARHDRWERWSPS